MADIQKLVDAIVETHRRVYAFDLDLDDALDALQREHGVDHETFRAALKQALPQTARLFTDYITRLNRDAKERLDHLDDDA